MAVWGHYYGPNLGDELVASTIIRAVRSRQPDAKVYGISLNPDDTRQRHGVDAYSLVPTPSKSTRRTGWRRYAAGILRRVTNTAREIPHLWASYRFLRQVDLVVVAGSGQLLDQWGGAWNHPYAVFKWSVLARLTGTRMSFLSVGAGPIDGRLAQYFIRSAIESAEYVSVRDLESQDVLHKIGVKRPLPVCPDMAFGPPPEAAPHREGGGLVLGVNAMAHASPRYWGAVGNGQQYQAYLDKFTRVLCELLQDDVRVRLFSSHAIADPPVADDLIESVRAANPALAGRLQQERTTEVDELQRFVGGCDAVLATRYHSVVVPLSMAVPTVAIAYHPKTVGVMRMMGQSEYCFSDIDAFEPDEVIERVRALIRNRAQVHASLTSHVPELREAVERQFDEVFAPRSAGRQSVGVQQIAETERGRHVA